MDVVTRNDRAGLLDEMRVGAEGTLRTGRERLVNELLERGYDPDVLREAHQQDRLAVLLLDEAMNESAVLSAREVADICGLDADDVLRASRLLGMFVTDTETRAFDEFSCEAFQAVKLARAYGLSQAALDEMLVVLGRHMSRLAADIEVIVGSDLGRPGDTEYELAHRYADGARVLAPNAAALVAGAFTAHLRDRMRDIFVTAEEAEFGSLRAVAEVAVAFVDVVGFTSLGERVDAGELKSIATRLVALAEAAMTPDVRLVKHLGDAILLVSRDASQMLRVLLAINEAVRSDPDAPPVHCGVAYGIAHLGGADVYGATVNRASRITDLAPSGDVWADAAVVQVCDTFRWTSLGPRKIKGAEAPVEVFRFHGLRPSRHGR
jgi:adenylate cyclase